MRRGQTWVANLNPDRGREIGKVRAVLVMQVDWLSEAQSRTVVVLPLSTDIRPETEPLRIVVPARDGLREDPRFSWISRALSTVSVSEMAPSSLSRATK